jgi:hypothetical protein
MNEIIKLTSDAKYGATEEIREEARRKLEKLQADSTQAG